MRYEKTVDGVHGQHLPLTYGATDGGEAGARRWTVATPDSHYGNAAGYARVRDLCWAGGRGLIRSLANSAIGIEQSDNLPQLLCR